VTLEGGDHLRRDLKSAARKLDDLSAAHERAGAIVAARGRANAPRRSGYLASTVAASGTKDAMEAYATAVYAGVHEYGWSARHIRAQPFLRPAIEDTAGQTTRVYTAELDGIVGSIKGD